MSVALTTRAALRAAGDLDPPTSRPAAPWPAASIRSVVHWISGAWLCVGVPSNVAVPCGLAPEMRKASVNAVARVIVIVEPLAGRARDLAGERRRDLRQVGRAHGRVAVSQVGLS